MKLEIDMPDHHYNNIIAFDSVSLGRVPYKGIIMYAINAIKHGKVLEQEPKTGYWIDTCNLDGEYKPIYMCSNCRSCYTEEMKPIDMIFCPNCGCRIVEPQESEE